MQGGATCSVKVNTKCHTRSHTKSTHRARGWIEGYWTWNNLNCFNQLGTLISNQFKVFLMKVSGLGQVIICIKIVIVDNSLTLPIIGCKLQKQNWKLRKNCFQSISEKARLHLVPPDRSDFVHFPELQNMLLDCILKCYLETKLTIDFVCHSLLPQFSPFIAFSVGVPWLAASPSVRVVIGW